MAEEPADRHLLRPGIDGLGCVLPDPDGPEAPPHQVEVDVIAAVAHVSDHRARGDVVSGCLALDGACDPKIVSRNPYQGFVMIKTTAYSVPLSPASPHNRGYRPDVPAQCR